MMPLAKKRFLVACEFLRISVYQNLSVMSRVIFILQFSDLAYCSRNLKYVEQMPGA